MSPPAPIFLYGHCVAAVPWYEASTRRIGCVKVHFSVVYRGEREGQSPSPSRDKARAQARSVFCGIPVYPDPCSFTGLHLTCGNGSGTGATFAFVLSPESP